MQSCFFGQILKHGYRDMAIYFDFDLSIITFEVTTISVVTFLLTCSVSGILKDKKDKGTSHPPS